MAIGALVVGLFVTVTAVSVWFHFNPPGGARDSMFVDDPGMTNSSPRQLMQQNSGTEP